MILFILIFFVMVIVIGAASVAGFSFFLNRRTRRRLGDADQDKFDEPPKYRSLFEPSAEEVEIFQREEDERQGAERQKVRRQNLTSRAAENDFTVLTETNSAGDSTLYGELLDQLAKQAEPNPEKLARLADFISENNLPATETLARDILSIWRKDSSAISTAKVLHISALSNSPENYLKTIDEIAAVWKANKLNVSADELFALFETHYWLLSNETRTSGLGFLLKDKLSDPGSLLKINRQ